MRSDALRTSPGREGDARAHADARRYCDALRAADAPAAERVVSEALAAGLSPSAVQSLVIGPAMIRIGELWDANALTIAEEHLATAMSQAVMVTLFERLRIAPPRSRERILLAAVEGQHHVLGLRMVADVLEGAGFDVLYLGADVPVHSLGRFAREHEPAVTGLGFGISIGVGLLAESIQTVREACPATRIMLGGRAIPRSLVEAGYPRIDNSMEVIAVVEKLLDEPVRPVSPILQLLRPTPRGPRPVGETTAESDPIAERMAEVVEDATETAREYVRRAEAFKELAFRDPVTELGNRRAFDDRMHALTHDESGGAGALLMIDVDMFKSVNDEQGHGGGDRLLRIIGLAIARSIRSHDFAARVGGDEFAVLLPKAGMDEARGIGARISKEIAADSEGAVTVSIGLTPISGDARGAVLAADEALYGAKRAGRNRIMETEEGAHSAPRRLRPRSAMYVSMSRLDIPPHRAPELVAAFRDRAHLADRADGFIDLQVWQSDRDPGEILMVSRWRDREAFTAYMKSSAHEISHDRIDPGLKSDITLRRLDHLHTYEVVAE
ncbi:MAG: diguanylate cyclase [Actinomycetota bacterium]